MNSVSSIRRVQGRLPIAASLAILPLLLAPSRTEAQRMEQSAYEWQRRSDAPPPTPLQDSAGAPSFAATLSGGVLGGILGGLVVGGIGYAVGSGGDSDGFVSESEAFGVIGGAIGYTAGSAVGAKMGSEASGGRPRLNSSMLGSLLGAVLGAVVWNRIGEGLESEGGMSSWYLGAAAGVTLHQITTAVFTVRSEQ